MKYNNIAVASIFNKSFIEVTKKVAKLDIAYETPTENEIEDMYTGIIITKGVYNSVIICSMQGSVMKEICKGMNNGKKIAKEELELYVGEYLNIVCGNSLTQINNIVGKASRLSVPVILKGTYIKSNDAKYEYFEEFNYSCWYGNIKINMEYTFSSS